VHYIRIEPIRIDIFGKAIHPSGKTFIGETGQVDGTARGHIRKSIHGKNKMD